MDVQGVQGRGTGCFSGEPCQGTLSPPHAIPQADGDHAWLRARCLKVIRCAFTSTEWTVLLPEPRFQSAMDKATRLDQAEGIIRLGISLLDARRRSEEVGGQLSPNLLKQLESSLSLSARNVLTGSPATQPPTEAPAAVRAIIDAVLEAARTEHGLAPAA